MISNNSELIPSVNYHLWEPCNFRCKFCFAKFDDIRTTVLPKGHLPREAALSLVKHLSKEGFKKITFAGGEPTLCPWISELIIAAKTCGLTTMLVTNGSKLNDEFFDKVNDFLDWVVLSIDSVDVDLNKSIGRRQGNLIMPDEAYYAAKVDLIKKWGIKLKINTVINAINFEDKRIATFIKTVQPLRWKIFQALKIEGQNNEHFDEMKVTEEQFAHFISNNEIPNIPFAVIEDNIAMTGTYIMVDPAGRFFDNTKGVHSYSRPILDVGVTQALGDITYSYKSFVQRDGLYEW